MPLRKPSEATPQQLQKLAIQIAGQGRLRITVNGTSMLPVLRPGDALLVDSKLRSGPEPGQILTFLVGDTMVTHRMVGTMGTRFLLKGDNAWHLDAPVDPSQLVGGVIAVVRRGKEREIRNDYASRCIAALSRRDGVIQDELQKIAWAPVKFVRAVLHFTMAAGIRVVSYLFLLHR